jgi:hypothetical protein
MSLRRSLPTLPTRYDILDKPYCLNKHHSLVSGRTLYAYIRIDLELTAVETCGVCFDVLKSQ